LQQQQMEASRLASCGAGWVWVDDAVSFDKLLLLLLLLVQ